MKGGQQSFSSLNLEHNFTAAGTYWKQNKKNVGELEFKLSTETLRKSVPLIKNLNSFSECS